MHASSRFAMQLFVKKVDHSKELGFTTHIKQLSRFQVHIQRQGSQPATVQHNGPALEAIEAATNLFRQFIQKNDTISLRSMARLLDDPDISAHWKEEFTKCRAWLNGVLDSGIPTLINGQSLSRRYICDIFINGSIAHAEPPKARVFAEWEAQPWLYSILEGEFIITIAHTFYGLARLADICREELKAAA